MALNGYVERATEPDSYVIPVRFEGAGAANPTKNFGAGVTVTWVSTGLYRLTFSDAQGTYVGCLGAVSDTVPAGVAGFTFHPDQDSYTAAGKALDVTVYNAANALADLPATSFLYVEVRFKRSSTPGA